MKPIRTGERLTWAEQISRDPRFRGRPLRVESLTPNGNIIRANEVFTKRKPDQLTALASQVDAWRKPVKTEEISEAAKAKFMGESTRDYLNKFGDPTTFSSLVLPELPKKAKTLAELQLWDKTAKKFISDFVGAGLGRSSDYVFGILYRIIRKAETIEELKEWDQMAKSAVDEYKKSKAPTPWIYVLSILSETIDKTTSPREMKNWDSTIKSVISIIREEADFFLKMIAPKIIKKVSTGGELRNMLLTAKNLISHYHSIKKAAELKAVLADLIDQATTADQLRALVKDTCGY